MELLKKMGPELSIVGACAALDFSKATFYRQLNPMHGPHEKPTSHRGLSLQEQQEVLDVLHEERFQDLSPSEAYATMLDEGRYLCSERTMYRVLKAHQEVRERRAHHKQTKYAAPELSATKPNELWSWDITKIKGPKKWNYFHLYVIIDVFSRYVVGWMVADVESSALAEKLIADCCMKQNIMPGQLTVHADRGSSMKSKAVALMLADLGVTKTHSRPHVSNDNPFSEAQFKTMKYRPEFPERFGCREDVRAFAVTFFSWYNDAHHHAGLGLMTPADVHFGRAKEVYESRAKVLTAAAHINPQRFVNGNPKPPMLQTEVYINPPHGFGGQKKSLN